MLNKINLSIFCSNNPLFWFKNHKKVKNEFEKEKISLPTLQKEEMIKTININAEIIENQIQKELEKPNKDFILILSKLFTEFKRKYQENNKDLSDNEINRNMTEGICSSCIDYLILQLP